MTKIQNSKPVLVIETGDPPAGWGVRRTNIGICNLFVISPSESPPSGRGPGLVLGI
jgi:hypothetical protein